MSVIKYNSELFDILKDLTAINTQIIIEKGPEGEVVVSRADTESTIAYRLTAPSNYFDFDTSEKIAFYNYPEFYQYFKALGEPDISINQKDIRLDAGSSKSNYLLSNPESIQPGPKAINFISGDVKMNLSSDDLDELLKMIGLINSKKAQITGNGKNITIKIFNNLHDNTFEKTFEVENINGDDGVEIDFVMFSDTFKNLPPKKDYVIEIKAQGFIKISLVDENIGLDIYTGRVKK